MGSCSSCGTPWLGLRRLSKFVVSALRNPKNLASGRYLRARQGKAVVPSAGGIAEIEPGLTLSVVLWVRSRSENAAAFRLGDVPVGGRQNCARLPHPT